VVEVVVEVVVLVIEVIVADDGNGVARKSSAVGPQPMVLSVSP
jgi:hypothetical protein